MVKEAREIPEGFIWKDCKSINARFPMLQTWFFFSQEMGDSSGFAMTRESIMQQGMFYTGLSINAIRNVRRKTGSSAVEMAQGLMQTFPLIPASSITRIDDGPLIILRRFFVSREQGSMPIPHYGGGVKMKSIQPTHFYIEAVGNRKTDTFYIIQFETPSTKWENDKETARIMIEKGVLDKSI